MNGLIKFLSIFLSSHSHNKRLGHILNPISNILDIGSFISKYREFALFMNFDFELLTSLDVVDGVFCEE
jgi:hypothetical protein